ncbi:MAG TPA: hypothetical protein ENJ11_02410 [Gammaproteobacteria bacterium]|nr:hypothetical protein [Gammaproteobacteria bacterium]
MLKAEKLSEKPQRQEKTLKKKALKKKSPKTGQASSGDCPVIKPSQSRHKPAISLRHALHRQYILPSKTRQTL